MNLPRLLSGHARLSLLAKRPHVGARLFGWKRFCSESAGVFGVPGLNKPSDWAALTKQAVGEVDVVRQKIYNKVDRPEPSILDDLDQISYTLCEVIDVAELCRSVHVDDNFRRAAEETVHELSDYLYVLGHDEGLYLTLKSLIDCETTYGALTEEQKMMASMMLNDFEKDGVHLEKEKQEKLREVIVQISMLESQFMTNAIQAQDFLALPAGSINRLPNYMVKEATNPKLLAHFNLQPGMALLHSSVMPTALSCIGDEGIREAIYRRFSAVGSDNVEVLEQLLKKRHEKANLLGHDSYIDLVSKEQMMGSKDAIRTFLHGVLDSAKLKIQKEMTILEGLKEKASPGSKELNAWDTAVLMNRYKDKNVNRSSSNSMHGYLELESVFGGLSYICETLFGLTFKQQELPDAEDWSGGLSEENAARKLVVHDDQDREVGVIYLDLYQRANKMPGATHFAIKHGHQTRDGEYQFPAVLLVTNFSKPRKKGGLFFGEEPTLLSHAEATTLFHEFGHALHTLISRTRFQHLAGTRVKTDFVEIPSHLMEYFLRDHRVLKHFAKHYKTKQPLPVEAVAQIQEERALFSGKAVETQLLWSLMDQQFHDGRIREGSDTTSVEILKEITDKYTSTPYVQGCTPHSTFRHFINYAGTYYSYLHARVYAAIIWKTLFEQDPLSPEAGKKFKAEILEHGGAKDPYMMLNSLLGKEYPIEELTKSYLEQK